MREIMFSGFSWCPSVVVGTVDREVLMREVRVKAMA